MNEAQPSAPQLTGQAGELRMTLQITRAATGLTEQVELVGRMTSETTNEEQEHGSNPQHSGA